MPHWGTSNEYYNMFSSRNKKNIDTFWLIKNALSRAAVLHSNTWAAMSENIPLDVLPTKIMISLPIHSGDILWSEFSLGTFWTAKDAKFLHADNDQTDQTAQMHKLIWVFVRKYVFSHWGYLLYYILLPLHPLHSCYDFLSHLSDQI